MIDFQFGIRLGPLSNIDPSVLRGWRNDFNIYRWCRQIDPIEVWEHGAWIESLAHRSDIKMHLIMKLDGTPIGVCGLTSIDMVNRSAEFSLYIEPGSQRGGYGQAALKTLCAYGFLMLGLNHIFGETLADNPAAYMFTRVGFTFDGIRRRYYYRYGRFIDAHLYGLLDEEFRSKWIIPLVLS